MHRKHRRAIAWVLILSMMLSPSMVYAQPAADTADKGKTDNAKSTGGEKPSLGYITPTAVAAIVAFPRRVLTSSTAEMMPTEVFSAMGIQQLGIDPMEVEQLIGMVEPPTMGPPAFGLVLQMKNPVGEEKILPSLWEKTEEAELDGKKYQKGMTPMDVSIYRDGNTIIIAHDDLLHKMLSNNAKPESGKISQTLGRVSPSPDVLAMVWFEPMRPMISAMGSQMPLPPPLADVVKLPELILTIGLKVNVSSDMNASLTIRANDDAAAEQVAKTIDQLLDMAKQSTMAQAAADAASNDPVMQARGKYSERMTNRLIEAFRPVRKGNSLTLATSGNAQMQVATIGVLMGLLVPAVQAAREAARRAAATGGEVPGILQMQPIGQPGNPPAEQPEQ
jgi:hypothetical protein